MSALFASLRSLLFAPGKDEAKLRKALASGADAVIADLEDAVPPPEKGAARATTTRVFAEEPVRCLRFVRVNGAGTEWLGDDLAALREVGVDGLMVPKATPAAIEALGPEGPPVIALIETAAGVRLAHETAAHPRVAALMLGGADLAAEANLEVRPDGQELLFARSTLVFASVEAGIRAPFDVVHLDVRDDEAQRAEATLARSVGFGGKACVHPAQLDGVHSVFTPTADETGHARTVLAVYEEAMARGDSVALLNGKLIDPPIVLRAQATLARARD
ncbi:CoA ester lyase [Amycolatopsis antarctica]|uniref:CoA ester lyase n=1 Tax=Amycolatopsis antarctica TaxID=1854586 RepID=A0A263CWT1_9PSEU|nr:CoA ester lyase [Amycolatopsis antarctica]OZM70439.1 CoA ester lyase [Amycolatopsis antarctica]